jgi:hypothetical protein
LIHRTNWRLLVSLRRYSVVRFDSLTTFDGFAFEGLESVMERKNLAFEKRAAGEDRQQNLPGAELFERPVRGVGELLD